MALSIKEYSKAYQSVIEALITDDLYIRTNLINCLDEWPECGLVIERDCEIIAVGVFTGVYPDKKTSMTLYVKPSERRQGIGTLLLQSLEDNMRSKGVQKVVSDFKINDAEKLFLYKQGYKHWFVSNLMAYCGEALSVPNYKILQYEDKDYEACHKVISRAFHEMRLSVGIESTLNASSEEGRIAYKKNGDNIFVLHNNDQIVAVVLLDGNEIDQLAVCVDQHGKGYGRALVSYAVNHLLSKGEKKINLWVVKGNPAMHLYQKIGFVPERTHEFVTHIL